MMCFLSLNGLCWELAVVCWHMSSIFYSFWDKLNWTGLKNANFQNLKVLLFHPVLLFSTKTYPLVTLMCRFIFTNDHRYVPLVTLMCWFIFTNDHRYVPLVTLMCWFIFTNDHRYVPLVTLMCRFIFTNDHRYVPFVVITIQCH
jgi:hypothetical protein